MLRLLNAELIPYPRIRLRCYFFRKHGFGTSLSVSLHLIYFEQDSPGVCLDHGAPVCQASRENGGRHKEYGRLRRCVLARRHNVARNEGDIHLQDPLRSVALALPHPDVELGLPLPGRVSVVVEDPTTPPAPVPRYVVEAEPPGLLDLQLGAPAVRAGRHGLYRVHLCKNVTSSRLVNPGRRRSCALNMVPARMVDVHS